MIGRRVAGLGSESQSSECQAIVAVALDSYEHDNVAAHFTNIYMVSVRLDCRGGDY